MRNDCSIRAISLAALLILAAPLLLLSGCGASGTATNTGTNTGTNANPNVASLSLAASSAAVPSDNSGSSTVTVTALSATNAAVPGVVVTLGTNTGIVSSQTVTTGADGTATFTFKSGTASLANRIATITASAGATAQIQIQIQGATLSVFGTTGSSVPNDGTSPVTVTFIAKNAQGTGLAGTPFTASWVTTTGGQLALNTTSGIADANGKFSVIVSGAGAPATGTATVTAVAGGASASATISVTAVSGSFGITQTVNGTAVTVNPSSVAMKIGDSLTVTVSAPSSTNVNFITSQGSWVGGTTTLIVPVAAGVASATLQQSFAGNAIVQVSDPAAPTTNNDTLTVGVTAVTPFKVTLTASPSVVAKGGGVSTLVARVLDANNQPVGNAAITFSLSNTTGGGETVSPVLAYTTSIASGGMGLGEAATTFTSGSLSSSSTGVQVRASVQGTTVATEANLPAPVDLTPSGNDAAIVIGGTAGSVALGMATVVVIPDPTHYQLPMSVQVADSNGNPVANTGVTLSVWPIAWATGNGATTLPCKRDADSPTSGTFYSEDWNGDLNMDPGEDGYRVHVASGVAVPGGTLDGNLTPINSNGGSVPGQATTDANGIANFDLTYLRTSAIWTAVRVRAKATVQGTEAISELSFFLPAALADTSPTCYLASPYAF